MERPLIGGWRCAVCGRTVDIAEPFSWRCPGAVGDDRHHALELVQSISPLRSTGDTNPFLGFRRYLARGEVAVKPLRDATAAQTTRALADAAAWALTLRDA